MKKDTTSCRRNALFSLLLVFGLIFFNLNAFATDAYVGNSNFTFDSLGKLNVNASGSIGVSGNVTIQNESGVAFSSSSGGGGTLLRVDNSFVTQPISALSLPLPTGAATSAKQDTGNTSLSSLNSKIPSLSLLGSALSVDGSSVTQPVSALSLPLPTGAATSGNQLLGNASLSSIDTHLPQLTLTGSALKVDGSAVTQPISGSVSVSNFPATQPISGSVSVSNLPATQAVSVNGRSKVSLVRNDYTGTPVTTAAYVELIASTSDTVNHIEIFDSSGQTMVLAVGGSGSEVDQLYVSPGGNGGVDFLIPSGSRVSIKAISANATAGEFTATFLK